jgi:hypothetical protein
MDNNKNQDIYNAIAEAIVEVSDLDLDLETLIDITCSRFVDIDVVDAGRLAGAIEDEFNLVRD